jgi:hypothetical protein
MVSDKVTDRSIVDVTASCDGPFQALVLTSKKVIQCPIALRIR